MDLVWSATGGLRVAGASTTAFMSPMAEGATAFGVRMRPGAAPVLLGLGAQALRDSAPAASEVLGAAGARLEDEIARAPDARAGIDLIAGWLAARAASAGGPDPLVSATTARLEADPGVVLGRLARELGVGERHLRRRVVAGVGYGPKRLARVLRLQQALDLAGREPGIGWAAVAYRSGYADQAHLTHDCSDLAGVPPTRLRA